jgi:HPt (histidine-containing phosphotransfer) domain-containing protein
MNPAATRPGDVARQLITALWDRSLPIIYDRLSSLDIACEAAVLDELTPVLRHTAADTAHKLAGSLGMFGYPRGTELAREIEHLMELDAPVDAIVFRQLVLALRNCLPL